VVYPSRGKTARSRLESRTPPAGPLSGAAAPSRRTSRASLSSRTPRKTGWRSFPSAVHSLKATSTTTRGVTQCGGWLVAGAGRKGEVRRSRRESRRCSSARVRRVKPVPVWPA
jgi:hypothetical protein